MEFLPKVNIHVTEDTLPLFFTYYQAPFAFVRLEELQIKKNHKIHQLIIFSQTVLGFLIFYNSIM